MNENEMIIEGRWKKTFTYKNGSVRLVNIYNGTKIKLIKGHYESVLEGRTTIGKIMRSRIVSGIGTKKNINKNERLMTTNEKVGYIENSRKPWVW